MNKINFENLPSTNTPVNAENLNLLQTNVDNAKIEKNEPIVWKEPGYGDKFRIIPDFNGSGSSNKLKIQSTTGGQGTDPTNFTNLISISADTGVITNEVTNKVVPTASYFNDYIIARSISTAFSTSSSTGGSVNINATVPSGYKFLSWVGVASTGWISKGLYIANYNQQTTSVFTANEIHDIKTITCFYLCIKNA